MLDTCLLTVKRIISGWKWRHLKGLSTLAALFHVDSNEKRRRLLELKIFCNRTLSGFLSSIFFVFCYLLFLFFTSAEVSLPIEFLHTSSTMFLPALKNFVAESELIKVFKFLAMSALFHLNSVDKVLDKVLIKRKTLKMRAFLE